MAFAPVLAILSAMPTIKPRGPAPLQRPSTPPPKTSGVAPEKPGPLAEDSIPGWNQYDEQVIRSIGRHLFKDEELLGKDKLPGKAVSWRINGDGVFNLFWESMNNRHDPSLLRAHARFLELTDKPRLPKATQAERAEVLAMVRHQLTSEDGLDIDQLDYFPQDLAIGVVKRLATAAGVPFEDVVVSSHRTKSTSLVEFEKRPAPSWPHHLLTRGVPPLHERRTDAGWKRFEHFEKLNARQDAYEIGNPGGKNFLEWNEARSNPPDAKFWRSMDAMLHQGDLSFGLPRGAGAVGGGRSRPAVGTPTSPTAPARGAAPAVYMTPWEMLNHPRFGTYVVAKRDGYDGSFVSYLYP